MLSRDTRSRHQVVSRSQPAARGWGEASSKNRSVGSCLRVTPASARFFACPQPQPHLRAGGVSASQTGGSERRLYAVADDDEPRLVQPVEDRGTPGIDGESGERSQPEEPGEGTPTEGEEEDEIGRVIEREAKAELVVAAVLVEEPGDGDERHRQPERSVEPWPLLGRQQIQKERRGDEEAHALSVEPDPEGTKLDLGQTREGVVEVALQERVVEQAVSPDLLVDAVCVQVRVTELAEAAEPGMVHPRHRNGDRADRQGIGDQLWE